VIRPATATADVDGLDRGYIHRGTLGLRSAPASNATAVAFANSSRRSPTEPPFAFRFLTCTGGVRRAEAAFVLVRGAHHPMPSFRVVFTIRGL
jgi:hypothetical protein